MVTAIRTEHEPKNEPNFEPSRTNFEPTIVPSNLFDLDFRTGIFSRTELAYECSKSEASIRKALKTIQQVIPLDRLERNKKITELGSTLVLSLFNRPETLSQAEWLRSLKVELAASPEAKIFHPDDEGDRSHTIKEKQNEVVALALRNENDLDSFFSQFAEHKAQQEEEIELDEDIEYQEAYQSEIASLQRRFKAKMKARADFDRKFQSFGL